MENVRPRRCGQYRHLGHMLARAVAWVGTMAKTNSQNVGMGSQMQMRHRPSNSCHGLILKPPPPPPPEVSRTTQRAAAMETGFCELCCNMFNPLKDPSEHTRLTSNAANHDFPNTTAARHSKGQPFEQHICLRRSQT
eukprot:364284-Chlamydomonas_euryale.AAC.2